MATGPVRTAVTVPRKKIDLQAAMILHLIRASRTIFQAINFSDIFLSILFRKFLCSSMIQKSK